MVEHRFLVLLGISVTVAGVFHYVLRYGFLNGIHAVYTKVVFAWIGAWLGSPVLGHWFYQVERISRSGVSGRDHRSRLDRDRLEGFDKGVFRSARDRDGRATQHYQSCLIEELAASASYFSGRMGSVSGE